MAKYVLISDTTLSNEYRNFPLLDFLPCVPTSLIPSFIYKLLKGKPPPDINGRASKSPYPLRKLESGLLSENNDTEVVVAHENHLEKFIGKDTEVIGVSTMDPLGIGPLTMSFPVIFGGKHSPYVKREFELLISRINAARKNTKAKLIVGGPGVWETMVFPDELERLKIDHVFQGEVEDICCTLFDDIANGSFNKNLFRKGFQTFDNKFNKIWFQNGKFISRNPSAKQFPDVDEIPEIKYPSISSLVETMRGCGIGCDFCEVTLRKIRYYPLEKIQKEIIVNAKSGSYTAWLQSDEIFAYEHGKFFEPNFESLNNLFSMAMEVKGISHVQPTHGRISIPAAFPELINQLSKKINAGPSNWIGIQVGLETGSERLAKIHMPGKTLPLKIGADGSWKEIVWQGVHNFNENYWRPAFTVQIGQSDEIPEDNWETVRLVNWLSKSTVSNGRPFEFSITPVQNVPLGIMKSKEFIQIKPDESQLAVYYVTYKHLAKIASRNLTSSKGGKRFLQLGVSSIMALGGWLTYNLIKSVCKKNGLDTDKVDRML